MTSRWQTWRTGAFSRMAHHSPSRLASSPQPVTARHSPRISMCPFSCPVLLKSNRCLVALKSSMNQRWQARGARCSIDIKPDPRNQRCNLWSITLGRSVSNLPSPSNNSIVTLPPFPFIPSASLDDLPSFSVSIVTPPLPFIPVSNSW